MTATEKPIVSTSEEKGPALAPVKAATATTAVAPSAPTAPLTTSKAASKVTVKKPAKRTVNAKATPVTAAVKKVVKSPPKAVVPAVVKPVAKTAPKATNKPEVKAVPQAAAKVAAKPAAKPKVEKLLKAKKPKLVRDSFTIPKAEYLVLDGLKQRAGKLANSVKKSELIRAGVKALAAMTDAAFLAALKVVPTIKTGRPSKAD